MKKFFSIFAALLVTVSSMATLQLKEAAGWHESAYMEFTGLTDGTKYNAYVSADGGSAWTKVDPELIRSYGTYGRVDVVGLVAGSNYKLKVVAVDANGAETTDALVSGALTVVNYERAGFAHTGAYAANGGRGVGAYNNDGSLKTGAKVLYVTAATAKTISTNVTGAETNPCVGMQAIIDAYQKGKDTTPIAFRIIGTLKVADMDPLSSSAEGLQIKGRNADSELNMTIEGIGKDAMLRFGFLVRNAASVEIRNLGIATTLDDDVSLDTDNDHIWIHNLDVYYGKQGSGDHAKGDGAIDVKADSKHVTVASNHFWDTGKSSMCGMTSESGANYITYHDNWFDHSDSRHARIRTMSVHMYNNYFDGNAKYCVGACNGSSVFVEANFFRNCPKPMLISKQGTDIHMGVGTSEETKGTFSGEDGGIIKSFGNAYSGSKTLVTYQQNTTHFDCWEATNRNDQVPNTVTTLQGNHTYDNFDTNASLMYTYTPDAASSVQANVTGFLGAGRINHGDLQFTFTAADDASYDVNPALRSAIDNYTSSLVAIIGNGASQPTPGPGPGPDPDPDPDPDPVGGNICHFTGNTPSNSQVKLVAGNYSNSKGSVTYDGTTYSICVKMESSTDLTITPTADCDVTLIFGGSTAAGGQKYKLDGVSRTLDSNGHDTFSATARTVYHVQKADGINLFLIVFKSTATGFESVKEGQKAVKIVRDGRVLIQRGEQMFTIDGRLVK